MPGPCLLRLAGTQRRDCEGPRPGPVTDPLTALETRAPTLHPIHAYYYYFYCQNVGWTMAGLWDPREIQYFDPKMSVPLLWVPGPWLSRSTHSQISLNWTMVQCGKGWCSCLVCEFCDFDFFSVWVLSSQEISAVEGSQFACYCLRIHFMGNRKRNVS